MEAQAGSGTSNETYLVGQCLGGLRASGEYLGESPNYQPLAGLIPWPAQPNLRQETS